MKWLVGIIIAIIVVIVGWFVWSNVNTAKIGQPGTTSTSTTLADIIPGITNQIYTDPHLSFSIEYPSTAISTSSFSAGYLPLTQTPRIAFELPNSMFQGTNLVEAGVYVGATTTPSVLTNCWSPSEQSNETQTGSTTIDGQDFGVFISTGAGAGNLYQQKAYRTIQSGWCLEIVELLHSGNIGNYPAGTVTQFDQAEYSGILDRIVQSYISIPTGY